MIRVAEIVCQHRRGPVAVATLRRVQEHPPTFELWAGPTSRGWAVYVGRDVWRLKCSVCGKGPRIGRDNVQKLGIGLWSTLGDAPHVLELPTLVHVLTSLGR